jgi:hypothetical protein
MPSKKQYDRLKAANRCPKCGKLKDSNKFITCSQCRKQENKAPERKQQREDIMSLFGIRRD